MNAAEAAPSGDKQKDNPIAGAIEASTPAGDAVVDWGILEQAAEASTADSGSEAPVNWESLGNLEYSSSETRKCSDITPEEIERQIEWIKGEYAKAKENDPNVLIGACITSLASATGNHFKFAGYQLGDRRPRRQEDEQWLRELCEGAIIESIREQTAAEASTADSGSEEDGAAPMAFAEQVAGAIDAEPAKAEPAKVGPAKDEKKNKRGGWLFGLFRRNK